jgi:excisionase family DNA binding protein
MTVPEVADRLRLSRGRVYELIRGGIVPAVRLGDRGSIRVKSDRLESWLDAGETR